MKLKAAKGTRDTLPQDIYKWHYIEGIARELTRNAGYEEIRTPIFEHTELFARGVGDGTDIVQKEMYTFEDKGHRSLTLKPEGTAGVVRAFVESGLVGGTQPTKLFYFSPVFRYERPQSGRLREHHQFGVELFGAPDPSAEVEVMCIALELFSRLGLKKLHLLLNSIGCEKCRPAYTAALTEYLRGHEDELCETCRERIEKNPLRVLDCKVESCQPVIAGAPVITEYLCDDCRAHMEQLTFYLDTLGVGYTLNPRIVRGLDYYTRTVFEIVSDSIGAQGTICGGGRYDHLVKQLGGPDVPAVGFGMGIERLLLTLEAEGIRIPLPAPPDVFIAVQGGPKERAEALKLCRKLISQGLSAQVDLTGRSLKAQFRYADKSRARHAVVIGERELETGTIVVRTMETGEEVMGQLGHILELIGRDY